MNSKIKAVIFDFDYTLGDSSSGVIECVNFAFSRMGIFTVTPEAVKRTIGLSLENTLKSLLKNPTPAQIKDFERLFIQRADEVMVNCTEILAGVPDTLQHLHDLNLKLGIVSTKYRSRIEAILRQENLLDFFEIIVGGEDVNQFKPNPEGLNTALRKINCFPNEAIYVGDGVVDATTAAQVEVKFVAVLSGKTREPEFQPTPLAILNHVRELPEWLAANNFLERIPNEN